MSMQYDFGFKVRRTLRLRLVEEILQRSGAIQPVPCRATLIAYLEQGTHTLQGKQMYYGWVVYEDSFKEWVREHQVDLQSDIEPRTARRLAIA